MTSIGLTPNRVYLLSFLSSSFQANRAMSEHMSMSSRHRRKSVPSFASGILGSGSRRSRSHDERGGSIDPLLDDAGVAGFSDGGESHGKQSTGTLHLSVSRAELDRYTPGIFFCALFRPHGRTEVSKNLSFWTFDLSFTDLSFRKFYLVKVFRGLTKPEFSRKNS